MQIISGKANKTVAGFICLCTHTKSQNPLAEQLSFSRAVLEGYYERILNIEQLFFCQILYRCTKY